MVPIQPELNWQMLQLGEQEEPHNVRVSQSLSLSDMLWPVPLQRKYQILFNSIIAGGEEATLRVDLAGWRVVILLFRLQ